MMQRPRLVFMGTPDFGVPTLKYLVENNFPVAGVVTQPDRPRGRGYQEAASAVKQAATQLQLQVVQPERVNTPEFLQQLATWNPDCIVVAAFGQILKQPLLDWPRLGCINLHASLLPKYRGASPIQWAIANGETETGVTVQKMALAVDSGDILVQEKTLIGPEETALELFDRLARMGGPAVARAVEQLADPAGNHGVAQDESQATFAPKLTREDGWIDWRWRADAIHNRVRGFYPWPGACTEAGGNTIKIIRTRPAVAWPQPAEPGTILQSGPDSGWLVAAGESTALQVLDVQGANTKIMSAHAYTCGHPVRVGTVLSSRGQETRRESHGG